MKFRDKIIGIGTLGIIILATPVVAYFFGWIRKTDAEVILAGYSPLATAVLVLVTWVYTREIRKDRISPLKKDELQKIIQPAISHLDSNIYSLGAGRIKWDTSNGDTTIRLHKLTTNTTERRVGPAWERFIRENPALWGRMEDHDELLDTLKSQADDLSGAIRTTVENKLDEDDIDVDDPDVDVILNFIVNNKHPDRLGPDHNYLDYWQQHEKEYRELVKEVAEDELDALNETQQELLDFSNALMSDLKTERKERQEQYGISDDDTTEKTIR
jgi:hypothetical protein